MKECELKVIEPGHRYELSNGQALDFIQRKDGELVAAGTTNEEVIEVLINRMEWLQRKLPCKENEKVIEHLCSVLAWLHLRTLRREDQGVVTTDQPHKSGELYTGELVRQEGIKYGKEQIRNTAHETGAEEVGGDRDASPAPAEPAGQDVEALGQELGDACGAEKGGGSDSVAGTGAAVAGAD